MVKGSIIAANLLVLLIDANAAGLEEQTLLQRRTADLKTMTTDAEATDKLLVEIGKHYAWMVDGEAIPDGHLLACDALPIASRGIASEWTNTSHYCSTNTSVQKRPSHRDARFYVRFVEAPCTAVLPHMNVGVVADLVFSEANYTPEAVDAWDNLDWDKLAIIEEAKASELRDMVDLCEELFPVSLLETQKHSTSSKVHLSSERRHEASVTHVNWRVDPVELPLAKAVGHEHSFLEIVADGQHYVLEVLPRELGITGGVKNARTPVPGKIHAAATSAALLQGLTVSDVLDSLRKHEARQYHVYDHNCHSIIQKTFHEIAPSVPLPASPNWKWESFAKNLDKVSPSALNVLLQAAGASRTMCGP